MRRILLAALPLFVLISSSAWADSVTIGLDPNFGFGDNFGIIDYQAGGPTVGLFGGTQTGSWDYTGFAPGQTVGGDFTVYLDGGYAAINGNFYELDVSTGDLFMSSITMPTSGVSSFTAPVTLSFSGGGVVDSTGQFFGAGGSVNGSITFTYGTEFGSPVYFPGSFVTPEPGTVGLLGTGLIGIFSAAWKKLKFTRTNLA
jgi:hypothetical protein